jgi:uncharacterized protein YndB with AHSA1/START domain
MHWTITTERNKKGFTATMPTPPQARVTRSFTASAERVFDAWLDSALIGQWMFGPALREEEVLHIQVDPRVGGAFSFLVRRNGQELDHVGKYLAIDRPSQLAFTWGVAPDTGEGSQVTIEIAPRDTGCELSLTHELTPEWADFVDRCKEAWAKMLGALSDLLDRQPRS